MSTLNHAKVRTLTPDLARGLGFDSRFVEFLFATQRATCFDYWVEDTARTWTCSVPDDVDVAYPLWSTNGDETLACVGENGLRFVQGFHDQADVEPIATSVQGLLTRLFTTLYENEATRSELEAASMECGFLHLRELLALEDAPLDAGADPDELLEQMIDRIDSIYSAVR